jgi:hypothetical protein
MMGSVAGVALLALYSSPLVSAFGPPVNDGIIRGVNYGNRFIPEGQQSVCVHTHPPTPLTARKYAIDTTQFYADMYIHIYIYMYTHTYIHT